MLFRSVFGIPQLAEKWTAFGWEVIPVDGHDIGKIIEAIEKAEKVKGKPSLILLDTIKGKSFSFAEGNAAYHNGILDEAKFAQAMKELDEQKAGLK